MMNYVLTARHLESGVIPELLGGINASGMLPSGSIFLPLFRLLSPFYAFLCMYAITFLFGFEGMYYVVRELTESNILAVVSAGLFCMLNNYPIYGLSVMGLPFVLYAFLCLQKSGRIWSYVILGIFSLGSHFYQRSVSCSLVTL